MTTMEYVYLLGTLVLLVLGVVWMWNHRSRVRHLPLGVVVALARRLGGRVTLEGTDSQGTKVLLHFPG